LGWFVGLGFEFFAGCDFFGLFWTISDFFGLFQTICDYFSVVWFCLLVEVLKGSKSIGFFKV
jgi:hypothetical protein